MVETSTVGQISALKDVPRAILGSVGRETTNFGQKWRIKASQTPNRPQIPWPTSNLWYIWLTNIHKNMKKYGWCIISVYQGPFSASVGPETTHFGQKLRIKVSKTLNIAQKQMTSIEFMVYMNNQHIWEYEKVWLMYRFRVPRAILGLSWAQNN